MLSVFYMLGIRFAILVHISSGCSMNGKKYLEYEGRDLCRLMSARTKRVPLCSVAGIAFNFCVLTTAIKQVSCFLQSPG
jgi:hypothetical protein